MEKIKKFKERLIEKENPPEMIEEAINVLSEFLEFLKKKDRNFETATSTDFYDFSRI